MGVNRGYTVTTGLWARSILQHQYGVDLEESDVGALGRRARRGVSASANVVPLEPGKKMEDMVVSGEIRCGDWRPGGLAERESRSFPMPRKPGWRRCASADCFPINHTLVVKDDLLAANSVLAADIFHAFAEAKRIYLDGSRNGEIAATVGRPTNCSRA